MRSLVSNNGPKSSRSPMPEVAPVTIHRPDLSQHRQIMLESWALHKICATRIRLTLPARLGVSFSLCELGCRWKYLSPETT